MKETAGQCWTVSRPTQKALEHGFNAVSFHTESMRCEIEIFSFFIFCGVDFRWFRQSNKERWCAGVLQQQRPWCCEVNHYNSTTNKLKATLCACCSNLSCWLPSPSLSFMSDHHLFISSALSDSDQLLSGSARRVLSSDSLTQDFQISATSAVNQLSLLPPATHNRLIETILSCCCSQFQGYQGRSPLSAHLRSKNKLNWAEDKWLVLWLVCVCVCFP